MDQVESWMRANRLKLNPSKTDFILFGSRFQLQKCLAEGLTIAGSHVPHSRTVKHLGVLLDESLIMKQQVTKMCRNAMLNFQCICAICPFLTEYSTQILVQGLVISHLDYCNIALIGLPETELSKLQRIQILQPNLCIMQDLETAVLNVLKIFTGCLVIFAFSTKLCAWYSSQFTNVLLSTYRLCLSIAVSKGETTINRIFSLLYLSQLERPLLTDQFVFMVLSCGIHWQRMFAPVTILTFL